MRGLKLTIDDTISNNFLHYFLLTGISISFTNEFCLLDLWMWSTTLVVCASISLGLSFVWSAFLSYEISILSHETMEEWPSTITSFVHVITSHEILWWKCWHTLSIFQLKSHFCNLSERNGVARTTVTLISMLVCEINTIDISPIEVLW